MGRPPSENNTFSKMLYNAFKPTEESRYKAYFQEDWWSLEEFACLVAGTIPEVRCGILGKDEKYLNQKNIERVLEAQKIIMRFLNDLETIRTTERILNNENFAMSAWRFIKWAAMTGLPIKECFVEALPFPLLEIYLEFTSANSPLRTKPKSSLAYHRALYLKGVKKLISKSECQLSPEEIFRHRDMQNVLRQIRALGRNYKVRTVKGWIATLEKRKRGRPKKKEPVEK